MSWKYDANKNASIEWLLGEKDQELEDCESCGVPTPSNELIVNGGNCSMCEWTEE